MSADLYEACMVYRQRLNGLTVFLKKGEAWARERGLSGEELLNARLYPDMLPLYRQIQIVCDFAVKAPSRAAGLDFTEKADAQQSFAELHEEIDAAKVFLDGLRAEQFQGRAGEIISFPVGPNEMAMPAAQYILGFATPNFYFHLVTAYNILRQIGVPLGKADYFGMQ